MRALLSPHLFHASRINKLRQPIFFTDFSHVGKCGYRWRLVVHGSVFLQALSSLTNLDHVVFRFFHQKRIHNGVGDAAVLREGKGVFYVLLCSAV